MSSTQSSATTTSVSPVDSAPAQILQQTNTSEILISKPAQIPSTPSSEETAGEEKERRLFMIDLNKFMAELGKPLSKIPIMGYKELDLFQLFKEVTSYGGFNEVVKNVGTWSKIWKRLGNFDPSITDSSFRLKKNYERYLLDYEYKCFPENRKQAVEMEKQMQMKRSPSFPSYLESSTSASWSLKNTSSPLSLSSSSIPNVVASLNASTSSLTSSSTKIEKARLKKKSLSSTNLRMMAEVPREKDGSLKAPLVLGDLVVECLGSLNAHEPFVTDKHVWPVGYTATRLFSSMNNPEIKVKYTCKVINHMDKPQFVITAADDASPIVSHSASSAWRTVTKRVLQKGGNSMERTISVSGAQRYGITHPIVNQLIRELPNADKCVVMQHSLAEEKRQRKSAGNSTSPTIKRKNMISSSSSSGSEDSGEFQESSSSVTPTKVVKRHEEDFARVFATPEELDDLETAVQTLYSLKFTVVC